MTWHPNRLRELLVKEALLASAASVERKLWQLMSSKGLVSCSPLGWWRLPGINGTSPLCLLANNPRKLIRKVPELGATIDPFLARSGLSQEDLPCEV